MRFLDTRHTRCCVPQLPLRDVTCDGSRITFSEVPHHLSSQSSTLTRCASGVLAEKSGLGERECTPLESVPDSLANVLGR